MKNLLNIREGNEIRWKHLSYLSYCCSFPCWCAKMVQTSLSSWLWCRNRRGFLPQAHPAAFAPSCHPALLVSSPQIYVAWCRCIKCIYAAGNVSGSWSHQDSLSGIRSQRGTWVLISEPDGKNLPINLVAFPFSPITSIMAGFDCLFQEGDHSALARTGNGVWRHRGLVQPPLSCHFESCYLFSSVFTQRQDLMLKISWFLVNLVLY